MLERSGAVTFTGYDQISGEATILGLLVNGMPVPAAGAGTEVDVVLDRTPFYAEGGGQLADSGTITADGGEFAVSDVQTPLPGLIVHRGKVTSGEVTASAPAFAEVDVERRRALSRSHTATHLVHRALRDALGESAAQAGSENAPGRLRFDFTAPGRGAAVGAARHRGRGQRGPGQRPGRARVLHLPGGGARDGRAGAVRREVRRPGPRGRGRRLLP